MNTNTNMNNEILNLIRQVITTAERLKNAYFWHGVPYKSQKYYEQRDSVPEVTWEEGGHTYSAEIQTQYSNKHVYVNKYFYRDGNKTTLTAIKNSFCRMGGVLDD